MEIMAYPLANAPTLDGFYAGYFTGREGRGLALFVFQQGRVVGSDLGGITYDGEYTTEAGSNTVEIDALVKLPPGASLIQGGTTPSHGGEYEIKVSVPVEAGAPYVRVETPHGPINMRLVKLRDLH